MVDVVFSEVLRAPVRTALRVLAIGGALSVTLLFEGFRLGIDQQMGTPARSLPASLVVVEEGAKHFVGVRSDVPQSARAEVERVPGVRAAHPLVSVPVIFERAGRRTPLQLLAYDSAGAPALGAGAGIAGPRQIVLDERLARLHGLGVGARITLFDRELIVAGLSLNTDVSFAPFAFVTYDELIDLLLEANVPGAMGGASLLSFLLVEVAPGAQVARVRSGIEATVAGVDVFTPAELAASDVNFGRQLFGAVLNLLVAVAWIAIVLAVGLTLYVAVLDRRRDFGVMKALGVPLGSLALMVVFEAVLVVACGFPLALAIARAAGLAVESLSPLYRVVPWAPPVLARGAIAGLVAGLAGSLVPLRRLAGIEPDLVFRS